jgi:hypothetical protein
MLNYEKWKLLNETLVPINLGFRPSHSLGITGAHLGQNTEETIEEEHDMDEVDFEAEDDMGDEVEEDMEFDGEDEDMEDGEESEMEMDADEEEDEDEEDEYSGGCPAAKMSSEDEDEESEDEHEHEHEGEDMDFEFESTNNQSKTWWESVAGMVGTKGQYKNASTLTEEAAKAAVAGKDPKAKEEEGEEEELVGKAALTLGKLKTFMNEHDVNAMNVAQVKGFIKGFCSYVLKNNKKVSPVTLKQELLSIAAQYGSSK